MERVLVADALGQIAVDRLLEATSTGMSSPHVYPELQGLVATAIEAYRELQDVNEVFGRDFMLRFHILKLLMSLMLRFGDVNGRSPSLIPPPLLDVRSHRAGLARTTSTLSNMSAASSSEIDAKKPRCRRHRSLLCHECTAEVIASERSLPGLVDAVRAFIDFSILWSCLLSEHDNPDDPPSHVTHYPREQFFHVLLDLQTQAALEGALCDRINPVYLTSWLFPLSVSSRRSIPKEHVDDFNKGLNIIMHETPEFKVYKAQSTQRQRELVALDHFQTQDAFYASLDLSKQYASTEQSLEGVLEYVKITLGFIMPDTPKLFKYAKIRTNQFPSSLEDDVYLDPSRAEAVFYEPGMCIPTLPELPKEHVVLDAADRTFAVFSSDGTGIPEDNEDKKWQLLRRKRRKWATMGGDEIRSTLLNMRD